MTSSIAPCWMYPVWQYVHPPFIVTPKSLVLLCWCRSMFTFQLILAYSYFSINTSSERHGSQLNDWTQKVDTVGPLCAAATVHQHTVAAPKYQKFSDDPCATEEPDHMLHPYSSNAERKLYKSLCFLSSFKMDWGEAEMVLVLNLSYHRERKITLLFFSKRWSTGAQGYTGALWWHVRLELKGELSLPSCCFISALGSLLKECTDLVMSPEVRLMTTSCSSNCVGLLCMPANHPACRFITDWF